MIVPSFRAPCTAGRTVKRARNTAVFEGVPVVAGPIAHVQFNFDLPWNPMDVEQGLGRVHRHGRRDTAQDYNLNSPVGLTVRRCIASGTVHPGRRCGLRRGPVVRDDQPRRHLAEPRAAAAIREPAWRHFEQGQVSGEVSDANRVAKRCKQRFIVGRIADEQPFVRLRDRAAHAGCALGEPAFSMIHHMALSLRTHG
jgi:hypothetical protein